MVRQNKSAIQAIEKTRTRCWRKDWVLEFDIKGLFDNIRQEHSKIKYSVTIIHNKHILILSTIMYKSMY